MNCTLSGNEAALEGGGCYGGILKNCIIWDNSAPGDANYYNADISHSCSPGLSGNGTAHLDLQLKRKDDLTGGVWSNAGEAVTWTNPVSADKAYYRVRGE